MQELNYFQTYLDEEGMDTIVGNLPYTRRDDMARYMRTATGR